MSKVIDFILGVLFDFTVVSIAFWTVHLIFTWPWLLVAVAMVFAIGVRYEDYIR